MNRIFIIRPFGTKKGKGGKAINFDLVQQELILPAMHNLSLGGGTTGDVVDSGNIREDMFAMILEADIVICDVSIHNANVFYELGIRHAQRKRGTILIKAQEASEDEIPFDLLTDRYLNYSAEDPAACVEALTRTIDATLNTQRSTDSPIFKMLPNLSEADPSQIRFIPIAFSEDLSRAAADAQTGKARLRLLAGDVADRRFRWEGLRQIAAAQTRIKDYIGSSRNWETIRKAHPGDVPANLALADAYERIYRETRDMDYLMRSDQAIQRVLDHEGVSRKDRAEALALLGRNHKTRWRLEFENLANESERITAALNRAVIRSYLAYRDAYHADLNHFYPGLNALQLAAFLLLHCDNDHWYDLFDTDEAAIQFRNELNRDHQALLTSVAVAIDNDIAAAGNDGSAMWAEISKADLLFLTNAKRPGRVLNAYRYAIPPHEPFAWEAAWGQLKLFGLLGMESELVGQIQQQVGGRMHQQPPREKPKPLHVLVVAGARSTSANDEQHRATLLALLEQHRNNTDHDTLLLAGARSHDELLAHELCEQLGLRHTLCLPCPTELHAASAYSDRDDLKNRFLDLATEGQRYTLHDSCKIPDWLHGSSQQPGQRFNRWLLELAQTQKAAQVSLLVLDDDEQDELQQHLVQLAEGSGSMRVRRLFEST